MFDPVDPDFVPAVGMRGIPGEPGEAGLGRDIRRQVRLTRVLGHRDDVDDVAGRPRSFKCRMVSDMMKAPRRSARVSYALCERALLYV
jgi:hypothetical protein